VQPPPANPVELLASPRLKEFVDDLRQGYDFVLIDTPPLLEVPDPLSSPRGRTGTSAGPRGAAGPGTAPAFCPG
jgi:hypothetical protein